MDPEGGGWGGGHSRNIDIYSQSSKLPFLYENPDGNHDSNPKSELFGEGTGLTF